MLLWCLCIQGLYAQGSIIYVKADASGANTGESWEDAFDDLQDALAMAQAGKQIWVAKGIYYPTPTTTFNPNPDISFELKDGVSIYGGFAGTEQSLDQRSTDSTSLYTLNPTILSGNIGDELPIDNSRHVVIFAYENEEPMILLDGFIIQEGWSSDIFAPSIDLSGGGMWIFNVGSSVDTSGTDITVRNCFFRNNEADFGGGVSIWRASPTFENCIFENNTAFFSGGAVDNFNGSYPIFSDCIFQGNRARILGGGMYNRSNNRVIIAECSFINNTVDGSGGGIYNSNSFCQIENSNFINNTGEYNGGAIYAVSDSKVELIHCTFKGNEAGKNGGGLSLLKSFATLVNCELTNNSSGSFGGCIHASTSSDVEIDSSFLANNEVGKNDSELAQGGAFWIEGGTFRLLNSFFVNNKVIGSGDKRGGACRIGAVSSASIERCEFRGNFAVKGGAIFMGACSPMINACLFEQNQADSAGSGLGGAIFCELESNPNIFSSNFKNNVAYDGGGIYHTQNSTFTIENSSLINNSATRNGGGIMQDSLSVLNLSNSTLSSNRVFSGDGDNIFCLGMLDINSSTIYQDSTGASNSNLFIDSTGILNMSSSILAKHPVLGNHIDLNGKGMFSSEGNNLIGSIDTSQFSIQPSDHVGTSDALLDPRLKPLEDNGYGILTHGLLQNSAAINTGEFLLFLPENLRFDQRGYSRITNTDDVRSDIGAYERHSTDIQTAGNFTLCAGDSSSFQALNDIVFTDFAGGAFGIGDSLNLIIELPQNIDYNIDSAKIKAEGEGIKENITFFDLESNLIYIDYNRTFTNSVNSITISGLKVRFNSNTVVNGAIKRIGGNAPQIDNEINSVVYAAFNSFPIVSISPDELYSDSFEEGRDTLWIARGNGNIWEQAEPSGSRINTAKDGDFAWITDTDGIYLANDSSIVESACYDLRSLESPIISLDIWSDTEDGFDGTVLQYSTDQGQTWVVLGDLNAGIEWYNSETVLGNPGAQASGKSLGWTGRYETWREAKYLLQDSLIENNFVRFRMAFGSTSTVDATQKFEGFAFDDFSIGERNANALIEYFTNDSLRDTTSFSQTKGIIPIRYHTSFPEPDFWQETLGLNEAIPNARVLYYKLDSTNQIFVNGRYVSEQELLSRQLTIEFLQEVKMRIDTLDNFKNLRIQAIDPSIIEKDLVVHMALVADTVSVNTNIYEHVILDMLPNAGGTYIQQWNTDNSFSLNFTPQPDRLPVGISDYITGDSVKLVVFVQDIDSAEVYQAIQIPVPIDGTIKRVGEENDGKQESFDSFLLFPNPAREQINVAFGEPLEADMQWELVDARGRAIKHGELMKDLQTFQIHMGDIAEGHYLLKIGGTEKGWGYHRVVVMK